MDDVPWQIPDATVDSDLLDRLLSDESWLNIPSCSYNSSTADLSGGSSDQQRRWKFQRALARIKEALADSDVLIQLWQPVSDGSRSVLITSGQPFALNPTRQNLIDYRDVSTKYQFSAEVDCDLVLGLPGRVFLGRLPEWSPDVRYFSSYEYLRVEHAQVMDVNATVALPVFERGRRDRSCLGVIEVIMTRPKMSFSSELNVIISCLQEVNLRSTEVSAISDTKAIPCSYQSALSEISCVISVACTAHRLPLAQTWVSCCVQGKSGSRHSDENFKHCIATVDHASCISDPSMLAFHQACSEHHLLKGQGMVGKAFMTNQPCFLSDIKALTKSDYPLSHHAKMFGLRGVVAIRLRCTHTGNVDFVLEFFLPVDCITIEDERLVLEALSATLQNNCQTMRVVTDAEIAEEAALDILEMNSAAALHAETDIRREKNASELDLDQGTVSMDGSLLQPESPVDKIQQGRYLDEDGDATPKERKYTKMEKTVSLQVLRQYFAGSLKDAAKNIGVCPTTLKRICRQHGIQRWPSRKLKKVDHSLRKLQVIIESVHGFDAKFELSSLYNNLSNASGLQSYGLSSNLEQLANGEKLSREKEAEKDNLPAPRRTIRIRPESRKLTEKKSSLSNAEGFDKGWIRVKAISGTENVRFRINPSWKFHDLKKEIIRRFDATHANRVILKYLDEESEWILLTCDADLDECIRLYKSSDAVIIKISAFFIPG